MAKSIRRDLSKSKSWFQRTARCDSSRREFAKQLRIHRTQHFNFCGYVKTRSIEWLKKYKGFDLEKQIRKRMPKKGKLNVLDSGAGFMFVGAGLKRLFGKRAFVTALNLLYPKFSKELQAKMASQIELEETPSEKKRKQRIFNELLESEKNMKLVNECRVSPIETFSSRRKYDVILDFCSPLYYSPQSERVFERYLTLLKPNGCIFTDHPFSKQIVEKEFRSLFGQNGTISRKKGYFFRARQIPGSKIWEIKKIPLKKKQ